MAKRNDRMLKVNDFSRNELWAMKCDLEKIEGRKISMGEVLDRILKANDIPKRLKQGSMDRRLMRG